MDMAKNPLAVTGIYTIRNTISGRVYVGSSINVAKRWNAHRCELRHRRHHSASMQRSWDKHGAEAFEWTLLESTLVENLFGKEQEWMDRLHAACPKRGFNNRPIAESPRGTKASPETRALLSRLRKGKKLGPMSDEHRAKLSAARKGHKASPELRAKLSAIGKGKKRQPFTAEHIANLTAALKGRKFSDEARARLSASRKGRKKPRSPEWQAKITAANIGRKHRPESIDAMRKAMSGRKLSPEHAANVRAARRERARLQNLAKVAAVPGQSIMPF